MCLESLFFVGRSIEILAAMHAMNTHSIAAVILPPYYMHRTKYYLYWAVPTLPLQNIKNQILHGSSEEWIKDIKDTLSVDDGLPGMHLLLFCLSINRKNSPVSFVVHVISAAAHAKRWYTHNFKWGPISFPQMYFVFIATKEVSISCLCRIIFGNGTLLSVSRAIIKFSWIYGKHRDGIGEFIHGVPSNIYW